VAYGLMIVAAVGLFLVIRARGETLTAPPSDAGARSQPAGAQGKDDLRHVLVALAAILAAGQLVGRVFVRLGQPPVIGQVVAGILLGPSLLGAETSALVLPPSVAPSLGVVAQLGVVLYMFLVGLELNPAVLRSQARVVLVTAHAGIVVPFLLGAALALVLYPALSHGGVPFTSFALFLGVSLSVTAFPVLARILQDLRMDKSELGVLALGCAAAGDATAWCLLAFVAGVAQAQVSGSLAVAGLTLAYVAFMLVVVRPLAAALARSCERGPVRPDAVALVFLGVLLSALATEAAGIHALFGAFLLGALVPHDSRLAHEVGRKVHDVVSILLLPAFFAYTGMRTEIGLVAGADGWLWCGLIVVAATAGKVGGSLAGARLAGLDWRTSASLGVLMNTRGLMELIVLNVGLNLGILSPTLFAMLVLMALATTLATAPLLRLLT
jgi:Kef-type K+ transport system membrane component KefB